MTQSFSNMYTGAIITNSLSFKLIFKIIRSGTNVNMKLYVPYHTSQFILCHKKINGEIYIVSAKRYLYHTNYLKATLRKRRKDYTKVHNTTFCSWYIAEIYLTESAPFRSFFYKHSASYYFTSTNYRQYATLGYIFILLL